MGKIEGRNTVDHLYISYLLLKGFVEPLYINGWNLVNCYMAMSQKPGTGTVPEVIDGLWILLPLFIW